LKALGGCYLGPVCHSDDERSEEEESALADAEKADSSRFEPRMTIL